MKKQPNSSSNPASRLLIIISIVISIITKTPHSNQNCTANTIVRDLQNFTLNNVFVPHFSFLHKVQHTQQQLLTMLHSLSKGRMDPLSEAPEVHHQP
jgi:hypothetical protein